MEFINIAPQERPHGDATIYLTEGECLRFMDLLINVTYAENDDELKSSLETFNSDGEAYTLLVCRPTEVEAAKLEPHYTDPDYLPQPAPIPNTTPGIHDELLSMRGLPESLRAMLRKRKAQGLQTYGTPLQRGNGRDAALDCAEEVADAIAYAQQINNDALREALIAVWEDFFNA